MAMQCAGMIGTMEHERRRLQSAIVYCTMCLTARRVLDDAHPVRPANGCGPQPPERSPLGQPCRTVAAEGTGTASEAPRADDAARSCFECRNCVVCNDAADGIYRLDRGRVYCASCFFSTQCPRCSQCAQPIHGPVRGPCGRRARPVARVTDAGSPAHRSPCSPKRCRGTTTPSTFDATAAVSCCWAARVFATQTAVYSAHGAAAWRVDTTASHGNSGGVPPARPCWIALHAATDKRDFAAVASLVASQRHRRDHGGPPWSAPVATCQAVVAHRQARAPSTALRHRHRQHGAR